MAQLSEEEELVLIRNSHMISTRIREDLQPFENGCLMFKTFYPEVYSLLARLTSKEVISIFERYSDNILFREEIDTILSPRGKEWITGELDLIKNLSGGLSD